MLAYVAITLAAIGLFMAWRANRQNKELRERIAQTNSRVYNLRREIQESQERAGQEVVKLKFELLKLQGDLQVSGEMKIGEILAAHPQAQQVLAGFHIGGCASCMVDEQQSLVEAVVLNGRELEPVLVALNGLLDGANGHDQVLPEQLKTPNVQVQF